MKENKKVEIMLIVLCILLVLPLFIISKYNRPSADDYDYAIRTHEVIESGGGITKLISSAWKTDKFFYNNWQGLYTSAFLLSLQPGIFGESMYMFSSIIILVLTFTCLLISIHIINKNYIKYSFLFTLSFTLSIYTIIFLLLPSAVEGIYWFNGAMNYTPWVFFNLLNACLLLELFNTKTKKKKIILIIISALIGFITSGANHVTSFSNILILIFITIYFITKKRYFSLPPLISSVLGFIIMYIAPGTANRQAAYVKQPVFSTIFETIVHVKETIPTWISFSWIISLLILTPFVIILVEKNKDKFKKKFPFIPIILSMMIICGMFCVPYYAMGYFGERRVTNVIWITFMLLSFFIYILLIGYLAKNKYLNFVEQKHSNVFLGILSSCCLLLLLIVPSQNGESNSLKAIRELKSNEAKIYSIEMDERFKKYNDKNLKIVEVENLTYRPELLFFAELKENKDEWPNSVMKDYYNKTIYLKSEEN